MVINHVLVATGVNADGHREILGLEMGSAESEAGWVKLFRGLVARGLSVAMVTSDAHSGLVAAMQATLEGASWQNAGLVKVGRGRRQRWALRSVRWPSQCPQTVGCRVGSRLTFPAATVGR